MPNCEPPQRTASRIGTGIPAFLALMLVTMAGPARAQSVSAIRGTVANPNGTPIADAELTVLNTAVAVLSDTGGRFHLRGLPPGPTVLRVRRIGFKGQYLRLDLAPETTPLLNIVLEPGPYVLPELSVTGRGAKPVRYAATTKYDDYFRRQRVGRGIFFDRDDIVRFSHMRTVDLLARVPGTRVRQRFLGVQGTEIEFTRCLSGHIGIWVDGHKLNWQPEYQMADGIDRASDEGPATLDKVEMDRRKLTVLSGLLDQISISDIEMMEVYRGVGSIPAEFRDAGCGAIVIWTRG